MTLSIHVVVDNCPQPRLERALKYVRNVKQARYMNIAAGAQLDRGMQFVERVRIDRPDINIIWRDLKPEDTGIHTRMTPVELYNLKVRPNLEWFKRNRIIFMPDNESSGNDDEIKRYVAWEVELAVMLHADGLRGAFCRFSTGTIKESQYALLKPLFNAMLPGDVISPNEYSNAPGKSSGGHLQRYENMWVAAGRSLETVIGEAGIAVDYDPGKGYLSIPVSGAKYGQQMLDEEIWYDGGKIDRCLYLIGGFSHQMYQLGDDVLDFLEDHYVKLAQQTPTAPPVVIPTPTPVPVPVPPTPQPTEPPAPYTPDNKAIYAAIAQHYRALAEQYELLANAAIAA